MLSPFGVGPDLDLLYFFTIFPLKFFGGMYVFWHSIKVFYYFKVNKCIPLCRLQLLKITILMMLGIHALYTEVASLGMVSTGHFLHSIIVLAILLCFQKTNRYFTQESGKCICFMQRTSKCERVVNHKRRVGDMYE